MTDDSEREMMNNSGSGGNMFITRAISGIVLILITFVSLYMGGPFLFLLTLAISLIGMSELYKLVKVNSNVMGFAGYLTAILYYVAIYFENQNIAFMILLMGMFLIMTVYVVRYPKYEANQTMLTFFGIVYVAVMLSYIYQLRNLQAGIYIVWLIYICSWGNDTCAYLAGITLGRNGKHKMSPKLSPKKSVEGFFGGIIGAAVIGGIYAYVLQDKISTVSNPVLLFVIVCIAGAMLSVIGDLTASAIKRNYGIKDYGKLIPGHGGILDRYDSVIFTAPVIYYLIETLNRVL